MAARHMIAIRLATLASALGLGAIATPGCDEEAGADVAAVQVEGKTFFLEIADEPEERVRGLSGREHIERDGGMLFVFPRAQPLGFVMRDCPAPIDIAFLDQTGRVLAVHAMTPEPREEGEADAAYEARLTRYPSRFPALFAVETAGGELTALGVEPGDRLRFDRADLKRRAH